MKKWAGLLIIVTLTTLSSYAQIHVTTNGKATGDGSINNPLNLQTASANTGLKKLAPGDTVYIHQGTYEGRFVFFASGTAAKPIIIKPYKNDVVLIDGKVGTRSNIVELYGNYLHLYGIQVTNSSYNRISQIPGSEPSDIVNDNGINCVGKYNKIINCVVYSNLGCGITDLTGVDTEIYGNIIFGNGFVGPDRAHGHSFYIRNTEGTKVIKENICFNSFDSGILGYAGNGVTRGVTITNNTIFNTGTLSRGGGTSTAILVGGENSADRITVTNNHSYMNNDLNGKDQMVIGYEGGVNETCTITGNYITGGKDVNGLRVDKWKSATVQNNTFIGTRWLSWIIYDASINFANYNWNNNTYHFGGASDMWPFGKWEPAVSGAKNLYYNDWKAQFPFDKNSTLTTTKPTANKVIVKPNLYEKGRAAIVIYNWQKLDSVEVDLSNVLTVGAEYHIYDVENYFGKAVRSGKWDGKKVKLPLNLTQTFIPHGNIPTQPVHTKNEFGCYLLVSQPLDGTQNIPSSIEQKEVTISKHYPNPAVDNFTVEFVSKENASIEIELIDYTGRVLEVKTHEAFKGETNKITFSGLSGYSKGIYFVSIKNGAHRDTIRFIKK